MEIILSIIICIVIADFFTGLAHWAEDTYATLDTPFIAESISRPNIEHHRNPGDMGKNGNFFTRTKLSFILLIPFALMFYWHDMFTWQVGLTMFLIGIGNQIHAISHGACRGNKFIKFLQKNRIIQTPKHHAMHHVPPFDRDYCVLTNFVNPVLEKLYIWKTLEILVAVVLGVVPKRMTKERDYL